MHRAIILAAVLCSGLLPGCSPTSPAGSDDGQPEQQGEATSASEQAMREITRLYDEAMKYAPDDPVEWAKQDLQRIGDWEYRLVTLDKAESADIEAALNELGAELWEVFWVSESLTRITFYLKKSARSYLKLVPVSGLSEAISGSKDASE
jgi:hypothetical protein